jgi:hypothetical protein
MSVIIYKITNDITGKEYIGKTLSDEHKQKVSDGLIRYNGGII